MTTKESRASTVTRAARLQALIELAAPAAAQFYRENKGLWPPNAAGNPQCPYVIQELADGRRRIRLACENGDVIGGIGATVEAALAALEARFVPKDPQS